MDLVKKINTHLSTHPLFYVTRDVERALSLERILENYYIITNESPLSKNVANGKIFCVGVNGHSPNPLSTRELLENDDVKRFITEKSSGHKPRILVFKNTKQIEAICAKNNWKLLNPPSELAEKIENKISQVELFRTLEKKGVRVPRSRIFVLNEANWSILEKEFNLPFIVQFNRAHTGQGTHIIEKAEQLKELQINFPNREAKISQFIEGQVYTVNVCVSCHPEPVEGSTHENSHMLRKAQHDTLVGNPSLQITGQPELTSLKYATVGNDWMIASQIKDLRLRIAVIGSLVGKALTQLGWHGLFGIDCILKDNELFLIEINARQAASAVCESYLQQSARVGRDWPMTIMEANVASLLGTEMSGYQNIIIEGSQIFLRNREPHPVSFNTDLKIGEYTFKDNVLEYLKPARSVTEIDQKNYFIIPKVSGVAYKPNDELVRVQSKRGMVEDQGKLVNTIQSLIKALSAHITI